MPSVLWRCWLGDRKGIRPVKTEWWGTAMVSCLEQVQMICIWSSGCHCHPIISCSSKIQNGLPYWCRLTQVVLEKGRLMDVVVVMTLDSAVVVILRKYFVNLIDCFRFLLLKYISSNYCCCRCHCDWYYCWYWTSGPMHLFLLVQQPENHCLTNAQFV